MRNFASVAAVLFASSGIAHAQEVTTILAPPTLVEQVQYRSSELATASGIRNLRSRVRNVAYRLCAPSPDTFWVTFNRVKCTGPTLRDAFSQVDRAVAQWRAGER